MLVGHMASGRAQTMDQYTRQMYKASFPECAINRMLMLQPETIQKKTQMQDTHSVPEYRLKSLRESNPGQRVERQGVYQPLHSVRYH